MTQRRKEVVINSECMSKVKKLREKHPHIMNSKENAINHILKKIVVGDYPIEQREEKRIRTHVDAQLRDEASHIAKEKGYKTLNELLEYIVDVEYQRHIDEPEQARTSFESIESDAEKQLLKAYLKDIERKKEQKARTTSMYVDK